MKMNDVNVYESSYNRSVYSNSFWLPIGCSNQKLNTNCIRRTTIIFGLFSNEHSLWMSVNGTTHAKHFWVFLMLLQKFIENCWGKQIQKKVVFDNTRFHLTAGVEKLWAYLRLEINTLPAYMPHLVSMEAIFCISKSQISSQEEANL